jgi:4-amino-4-deoxy-L-arabinose transferase-like glycosyltransferase
MEVTRIQPQKPPLQQLFRVTFASVVFLLVVSIWAIVNYCQAEATQMAEMHNTM